MSVRAVRVAALVAVLGTSTCAAVLVPSAAEAAYTPSPARPTVVSSGVGYSLAMTPGGTVRAWGGNGAGELGNGTQSPASTPVVVLGYSGSAPLDHVVEVSAGGDTAYALRADGTVAAWGADADGQLGNGTTGPVSTRPVHVAGPGGQPLLTNVVAISGGAAHVLALRSNGTVVAWGGGADGELGTGCTSGCSVPAVVRGPSGGNLTGVIAVSAGYTTSYALTNTGHVYAWGAADDGALGANDLTPSGLPVEVHGVGDSGVLSHVVSISAGIFAALALLSDGTVVSWGFGGYGNQGDDSTSDNDVPTPVSALGDHIAAIHAGSYSYHDTAIGASGSVYAWGQQAHGDLCDGNPVTGAVELPENVGSLTSLGTAQLANGYYSTTAVDAHGAVTTCGYNADHELGDGSTVDSAAPTHPYALPAIGAPKLFLLSAPVVGGHALIGYTMTVTTGTWGLPPTVYAYQWLRDGRSIAGATHSTYRVAAADRGHHVSVRVSVGRSGYPGNGTTTGAVYISR